jgi:hypothetical protein
LSRWGDGVSQTSAGRGRRHFDELSDDEGEAPPPFDELRVTG